MACPHQATRLAGAIGREDRVVFVETKVHGVYIIEVEKREDERGFFARTFCQHELEAHALNPRVAQCGISFNKEKGTLRGMHYQIHPYEEAKLVRCTKGAIYDVALDLRRDSGTHREWVGVELSEENHRMLYIPEGCAHGFQTLRNGTEVLYQISQSYHAEAARGVRWNDPSFSIRWPQVAGLTLSERDQAYENY